MDLTHRLPSHDQRERRARLSCTPVLFVAIVAAGCASAPEKAAIPEPPGETGQREETRENPQAGYADWAKENRLPAIDEGSDRIRRDLEALGTRSDEATLERRQVLEKQLEIARLERQITQDVENFNVRPRRVFVGARAGSYAVASYLVAWQEHLETFGTKNMMPGVYGKVQLTIALRPDGTVETVELNKSSGNVTLDRSAVRIARLGTPYPRFLKGMESIDVLHITRTWSFETRGAVEASK